MSLRPVVLLGYPARHSLSPAMHNAAFQALHLPYGYYALDLEPARLGDAVAALKLLNFAGANLTAPFKEQILPLVDDLSAAAAAAGSVNTLVWREGKLFGHSTDGAGFLRLLAEEGVAVKDKVLLLLGAGGAAKAVALVLAPQVKQLLVVNRTPARALELVALLQGRGGRAKVVPAHRVSSLRAAAAAAEVIVNATSVGMGARANYPLDPQLLTRQHVYVDLIYHPLETPLMRAARILGARVVGGLGMLVHQAVLGFELWTGVRPDPALMRQAAEEELLRRASQ